LGTSPPSVKVLSSVTAPLGQNFIREERYPVPGGTEKKEGNARTAPRRELATTEQKPGKEEKRKSSSCLYH